MGPAFFSLPIGWRQLCGLGVLLLECVFGRRSDDPPRSEGRSLTIIKQSTIVPLKTMPTAEFTNWVVVAEALESQGATQSQMYKRARAMANGHADPMPTSFPAAPASISFVPA